MKRTKPVRDRRNSCCPDFFKTKAPTPVKTLLVNERKQAIARFELLLLVLLAVSSRAAAAMGGGFGAQQSNYTVTVTGTSGSTMIVSTVTLTLQ
jgi:hypothetical protein